MVVRFFVCAVTIVAGSESCYAQTSDRIEVGQDLCSDAVFLRRASVILTGRTPDTSLRSAFPTGTQTFDRNKLIDTLLSMPEFGQSWGRWLAKLTGCEEQPLSSAAFAMKVPRERTFWLWQAWAKRQLNKDASYAEIIIELIGANSRLQNESYDEYSKRYSFAVAKLREDFDDGELLQQGSNDLFWKTNRSAEQNAELIARNLLGYRLECAKCHDHPFTHWTTEDHTAFSAVFQRAVYAELPVKHSDKRFMVVGFSAAGFTVALSLFIVSFRLNLSNNSRLAFAANSASAISVAVFVYVVIHFRHLLLSSTTGKTNDLPTVLVEATGQSLMLPSLAIVCILAFSLLTWQAFRKTNLIRPTFSLVLNFTGFVAIGLVLLLTVDVAFAQMSRGTERPESLVSFTKRKVLHSLELGGQGQQIREVYDDTNGNFVRIGSPKAIDGPRLNDTADSQPRRQFAEWLVNEPTHQLQRNFVNRVAQKIFGAAFVTPVDDYQPNSEPLDAIFFDELVDGFISQDHSVKWLLKTMVLSHRFQTIPDRSNTARIGFRPRALKGEELVASLNQLSSAKITLASKWSPTPADPFSCGSEAPNWGDLGDRILNAAQCADTHADVPFEVVAILMLDSRFQAHLEQVELELRDRLGSSEAAMLEVARSLWGAELSSEQQRSLLGLNEDTNQNIFWALVNSPQFLILN